MEQKTAIILGATGLTGNLLLKKLIADENYTAIKLFSRKLSGFTSPKIKEFIVDMLKLEQYAKDFAGDVVYCCIGTTAAKTKDKSLYKAIDFGIPVAAAKLTKENNIPTFIAISALGANAKSKVFYNRTKGKMEEAVLNEKIPNTHILRPSLIVGNRNENRPGEKIGAFVLNITNVFLVGKFKKYRSIEAECIANAMYKLAEGKHNNQIVESDKIQELGAD